MRDTKTHDHISPAKGLSPGRVRALNDIDNEKHFAADANPYSHPSTAAAFPRRPANAAYFVPELNEAMVKYPQRAMPSGSELFGAKLDGAQSVEQVVLSLYARGFSERDIERCVKKIHGYAVSDATIANITARLQAYVISWQCRPLSPVYFVIFLEEVEFRLMDGGALKSKSILLVTGLCAGGQKALLGIWSIEGKRGLLFRTVFSDLRSRGVRDVLVICATRPEILSPANRAFSPRTIYISGIHVIRNSSRQTVPRDRKKFEIDLKGVYAAPGKDYAWKALEDLDHCWGGKYPWAIRAWKDNWQWLSSFFDLPACIRTLIYTINTIDDFRHQVLSYTDGAMTFPDEGALMKTAFLALRDTNLKKSLPVRNWNVIASHFLDHFSGGHVSGNNC